MKDLKSSIKLIGLTNAINLVLFLLFSGALRDGSQFIRTGHERHIIKPGSVAVLRSMFFRLASFSQRVLFYFFEPTNTFSRSPWLFDATINIARTDRQD